MVSERLARMTQRTWAALLAVPLFVALGLYVAVTGLPFVTYAPGPTVNVLGDNGDKPIIAVQGHQTYRDDGQLRMTTVSVTQRDATLDLFTLMTTWASRDDAVYPFFAQYGSSGSQQQDTQEGQVEMVTSQDAAVAAALRQLGHPDPSRDRDRERHRRDAGRRQAPGARRPAQGRRHRGHPEDRRREADRRRARPGKSVPITVERDGKRGHASS